MWYNGGVVLLVPREQYNTKLQVVQVVLHF